MIRLHHPAERPGVALLALDRPEKRNALTPDMLRNIALAAERAHAEHARAIVLHGAGPSFCSGFDLTLCRHDSNAMAELLTTLSHAIRALRRLSVPIVAAAHGAAIAGGCALLTGADLVITDAAAKLGYPVTRLGISPAVNAPALTRLLHTGALRERLLDPALISGVEAARIGLAHECLDQPEDVLPRALELAAQLAAKPAHALRATKAWLNELDPSSHPAAFDAALGASLTLTNTPEERSRLAQLWK